LNADLHSRQETEGILNNLFAVAPLRFSLSNGLTVLYRQDASLPLLSCQLWVRSGSIHEGPHTGAGLSHFLEHMVFKATDRREPGRISQDVTDIGASINAYTAFDRTVYFIDGPSENAETALDILEDLVKLERQHKPDLIFLPSSFDVHQDHKVIFEEVRRAFKKSSILGYEFMRNNFKYDSSTIIILEERHI